MDYLCIDGTMGEGGGSITRLAAGFSILFNKPIHLQNIRSNRNPPGLRLQHQLGLESLQQLSNGELSSIEVGTTELKFTPGNEFKTTLDVQIRTAGSIALLSQTIQTAFIHSTQENPIVINYRGGGTFGTGAPDPYYLNNVTYKLFEKMGYKCHIQVKKNGFYPKGGAMAILTVHPVIDFHKIKPLILEKKGHLLEIGGIIICSENLKKPQVGERISQSIRRELLDNPKFTHVRDDQFNIQIQYENTLSPGVGLSIWANYEHTIIGTGTQLGKRGVPSETVGKNAAKTLINEASTSATIDNYAADQLIPLLVMCPERSIIRVGHVSSHLQTNIELLQKFHPRDYSLEQTGDSWILKYNSVN